MAAIATSMLCASGSNRKHHRRFCFEPPTTLKTHFSVITKHASRSPAIFLPRECSTAASAVSDSPGGEYSSSYRGLRPCGCRLPSCAGSASTTLSEDAASVLERVEVFDLTGRAVPISDLWKDRKAVVAFARHFGCVLCRRRADFLASKKEIMDASGVALILVGPGSVEQAKAFSKQTGFREEVYADPNHSSYTALSFVSGISTTFTPSAGLKIIQLYLEGYRQDWGLSFEKDTVTRGGWQQGGIIVAGPGKSNISYIHKDKEAGDDPNIEDIMKACCS